MKKVVNEHGQLVLVRTPNMQQILTWCYNTMIPIAIVKGFDGAYEQAISDYLKKLYGNKQNRPWLDALLKETGVDTEKFMPYAFMKAANLIFKSKIVK
jgi:hypothetical protein